MKKKNNAFFIIDWQNDFAPTGAFAGALANMPDQTKKLVKLINNNVDLIDYIGLTQDTHQPVDCGHQVWWKKTNGDDVDLYTNITAQDVQNGTFVPQLMARDTLMYLEALEKGGEYVHTIWPRHCIKGSEGAAIVPAVMESVINWAEENKTWYQLHQKGEHPLTEHYGALRANVPITNSPSTTIGYGQAFLAKFADYRRIYFFGQARTHCVLNTLHQIIQVAPELLKKMYIVEDLMDDVPGLPQEFMDKVDSIFARAKALGATFVTSDNPQLIGGVTNKF